MVLLEAMAANIPIAATAVGGIPDVVSNTEAQLVSANVPASEIPAALARGIAHILAGGTAITQRVEAARTKLETTFGVEPWLDHYEALYRTVQHSSPT
jgi:glycosyltransferase involved in cell wall biosynthesis